jgi:hypothetical protein
MVRNVFAILIAPTVWLAIAFPGNQLIYLFYPDALDGQPPIDFLVLSLVATCVYTFAAGAVCGWIAKPDFARMPLLVGLALLAFSVFTQIVYWDVVPLWYHIAAVALTLPAAMAGANLIVRRRAVAERG